MHIGNDTDMGVVLHDLEPFTKYAVYVQAYSTALSKTSHTSRIVYFVTEPTGMCTLSFCMSNVIWTFLGTCYCMFAVCNDLFSRPDVIQYNQTWLNMYMN